MRVEEFQVDLVLAMSRPKVNMVIVEWFEEQFVKFRRQWNRLNEDIACVTK